MKLSKQLEEYILYSQNTELLDEISKIKPIIDELYGLLSGQLKKEADKKGREFVKQLNRKFQDRIK